MYAAGIQTVLYATRQHALNVSMDIIALSRVIFVSNNAENIQSYITIQYVKPVAYEITH